MIARLWHAVVASLVAAAVIVQVVVAIKVPGTPHEVSTGLLRGSSTAGRIIRVFSFFTIESNVLSGVVSLLLARHSDRDGAVFRPLRLAALFGITVTGIVYSTVLAKIHEPHGAAEILVNDLVHYVIPVMMFLGWFAFGPRPRIDWRSTVWSLSFPAGWFAYTLLRGAIWKWYPYPFVDVTAEGYARVIANAVLVVVVVTVVAALFAFGDRRLAIAPATRATLQEAEPAAS